MLCYIQIEIRNDCETELFSEIAERKTPLSKCGCTEPGLLVPIPQRPVCDHPSTDRRSYGHSKTSGTCLSTYTVPVQIQMLKLDTSLWTQKQNECKQVRRERKCTVYFFGAQEKVTKESDSQRHSEECVPDLSQSTDIHKTSPNSPKVLMADDKVEYPFTWSSPKTNSKIIKYRINTSVTVDHKTFQIFSPTSFIKRCNISEGKCRHHQEGGSNPKHIHT